MRSPVAGPSRRATARSSWRVGGGATLIARAMRNVVHTPTLGMLVRANRSRKPARSEYQSRPVSVACPAHRPTSEQADAGPSENRCRRCLPPTDRRDSLDARGSSRAPATTSRGRRSSTRSRRSRRSTRHRRAAAGGAGRRAARLRPWRSCSSTGPVQEVGLSSRWGDEFVALADRFDTAVCVHEGRAIHYCALCSNEAADSSRAPSGEFRRETFTGTLTQRPRPYARRACAPRL